MKIFVGDSCNISSPILGRVIEVDSEYSQGKFQYIDLNNAGSKSSTNVGMLLPPGTESSQYQNLPQFILSDCATELRENDVLLIEASGSATLLYRFGWKSNSLLLTEQCNCRCVMCPQPPKSDKEDGVDFSLKLVEMMHPDTRFIGITGGEPTLKWAGLLDVIEKCRSRMPSASIQLLSNGRLFNDFQKSEEIGNIGGKALFVGVPLYSDAESIHDYIVGVPGAYWETLNGIYNLSTAGVAIELRIVVTKINFRRLNEWASFVYRTLPFVDHIAIMALEPIGFALDNIEMLWIDPEDYLFELEQAISTFSRRNMSVSLYNFQRCTMPKRFWKLAKQSISGWKRTYSDLCNECVEQTSCGGFFQSGIKKTRAGIKPIMDPG